MQYEQISISIASAKSKKKQSNEFMAIINQPIQHPQTTTDRQTQGSPASNPYK
jgi:hypothetical protein